MEDDVELAPLDEELYYQDPFGFWARIRESSGVAALAVPGYGRAWVVTRYDDVRMVLADPRFAKDVHRWPGDGRSRPSEDTGVAAHMLHADPPDHARLRRVVQKAFTPRVSALRPHVEQVAGRLLDAMQERSGVTDLLDSYARPLPIAVLSELLGVPQRDRARIASLVARYDELAEHERVEQQLAEYLAQLIDDRRRSPGDDLLSDLLATSGAGQELTDNESLSTVYLMVMAGFDTTVNLIASGALALLSSPDQAAMLRQDTSLLPRAVEELLRFTSPVNHANDRFTIEDVAVGGVLIPAGEWVLPAISSANRDPGRFPQPDQLELDRDSTGHVAFGHGVHHCLGAPLARLEAEIALGAMIERFPRMTLAAPQTDLRWRANGVINGLESLPIRLS